MREFHHSYSAERQALVDLIARGIDQGEFRWGLDPEVESRTTSATWPSSVSTDSRAERSLTSGTICTWNVSNASDQRERRNAYVS